MPADSVVYGLHAVSALLKQQGDSVGKIYVSDARSDKRIDAVITLARDRQIPISRLPFAQMNQRFPNMVHQGVIAITSTRSDYSEQDLSNLLTSSKQPNLILILDGVTDPHNLGACLRSADAAGVNFVMTPKDKSVGLTPVVSKVACGAAESIPLVRVTNLVRAMEKLKQYGVWIYGASGDATESIYDLDYKDSVAIVLGAEGKGMRRLTREHCDAQFALPMLGSVSSLNVSVATGICLYEVIRQRL